MKIIFNKKEAKKKVDGLIKRKKNKALIGIVCCVSLLLGLGFVLMVPRTISVDRIVITIMAAVGLLMILYLQCKLFYIFSRSKKQVKYFINDIDDTPAIRYYFVTKDYSVLKTELEAVDEGANKHVYTENKDFITQLGMIDIDEINVYVYVEDTNKYVYKKHACTLEPQLSSAVTEEVADIDKGLYLIPYREKGVTE